VAVPDGLRSPDCPPAKARDTRSECDVIDDRYSALRIAARESPLPSTRTLAHHGRLEDHTVWIRTQDGRLWLAPYRAGSGLTWGYRGTGPVTLARLLPELLRDITTSPTDDRTPPDRGMLDLVATKWPDGTVLTRAHLLNALTGDQTDEQHPRRP
jgi:hypothetical protein